MRNEKKEGKETIYQRDSKLNVVHVEGSSNTVSHTSVTMSLDNARGLIQVKKSSLSRDVRLFEEIKLHSAKECGRWGSINLTTFDVKYDF